MTKLEYQRRKKNLTQRKVAAALGVTEGCVSCWESGRYQPKLQKLVQLSKIYNVSLEDLIGTVSE